MNGTEKQIKWATDIRNNFTATLDSYVEKMDRIRTEEVDEKVKTLKDKLNKFSNQIKNDTEKDAKYYIETREKLTQILNALAREATDLLNNKTVVINIEDINK